MRGDPEMVGMAENLRSLHVPEQSPRALPGGGTGDGTEGLHFPPHTLTVSPFFGYFTQLGTNEASSWELFTGTQGQASAQLLGGFWNVC